MLFKDVSRISGSRLLTAERQRETPWPIKNPLAKPTLNNGRLCVKQT